MIRPFGETLRTLVEAVEPVGWERNWLRVTDVYFDLPIIAGLRIHDGETDFLGDLPLWRWPTAFDVPPGRMRITWQIGGAA